MPVIWIYKDGHLLATRETGEVITSWVATAQQGYGLATAFNHAPAIGLMVLSPWLNSGVSSTD